MVDDFARLVKTFTREQLEEAVLSYRHENKKLLRESLAAKSLLRDEFAKAVIAGWSERYDRIAWGPHGGPTIKSIAEVAYEIADAMLTARSSKVEQAALNR